MPYLAKSFRNVSKNSTNIYKTKQTNKVNPVKYTKISLGKVLQLFARIWQNICEIIYIFTQEVFNLLKMDVYSDYFEKGKFEKDDSQENNFKLLMLNCEEEMVLAIYLCSIF